jgi:hypothetical protein
VCNPSGGTSRTYVTGTIAHIAHNPGYGGSILDYGFLDAQWDINGGAGGWAADDIERSRIMSM